MQYKDLDLKKLRDDNGLDFAHYTYLKDMCTCCYGPLDFPKRYWKNGEKPKTEENVQYILFGNAENGAGDVKDTDEIRDVQSVGWQFPMEKMEQICKDLQEQLGNEYVVLMPTDEFTCIKVYSTNYFGLKEKIKDQSYICITDIV